MATIQELTDSGEIRIGANNFYEQEARWNEPALLAEDIRRLAEEKYAGAVLLRPGDSLPPEVGQRCWASRLYTLANRGEQHYDAATNQIIDSPPPCWLVEWTTDEIEAAYRIAKQEESVVDRETFDAMRSFGIEDIG